jgi:predicted dehydrogenase
MKLAIIGCGYVADFYITTLANYPTLEVVSVSDRDPRRAERFGAHYGLRVVNGLEAVLRGDSDIVVNLTNPVSHFEITWAALGANKHVYSEKPLGMSLGEAKSLVELAERRSLYLACAPCSVLGETAQTLLWALRQEMIGVPRLVFAELSDGLIHLRNYREWITESGAPWPYMDEFEVGCALEHAGYYVTWLVTMFGPARAVTTFASTLVADKGTSRPLCDPRDDFYVACIEFASGVIARLTCSIYADADHSLRIFGDRGALSTPTCWDYDSPVYALIPRDRIPPRRSSNHVSIVSEVAKAIRRSLRPWRRLKERTAGDPEGSIVPPVRPTEFKGGGTGAAKMDFARGIAEMADAIEEWVPARLGGHFALHTNEIVLVMSGRDTMNQRHELETTCEPMSPMPWARGTQKLP